MADLIPPPDSARKKFKIIPYIISITILLAVKASCDRIWSPNRHNSSYSPSSNSVTETPQQIAKDSDEYYFRPQMDMIVTCAGLDSAISDSSVMFKLKSQIESSTTQRRAFLDSFFRAYYDFSTFCLKDNLACDISFHFGRKDSTCSWDDSTEKYYAKLYYDYKFTLITRFQQQYDSDIAYYKAHPENVTLPKKEAETTAAMMLLKLTMAFSRNYKYLFGKELY